MALPWDEDVFDLIFERYASGEWHEKPKIQKKLTENSIGVQIKSTFKVKKMLNANIEDLPFSAKSSPSIKPARLTKLHNLKDLVKVVEYEHEEAEHNQEGSSAKGFSLSSFQHRNLGLTQAVKKRLYEHKYVDQELDRLHTLLEKAEEHKAGESPSKWLDTKFDGKIDQRAKQSVKHQPGKDVLEIDWSKIEDDAARYQERGWPTLVYTHIEQDNKLLEDCENSTRPRAQLIRDRARYLTKACKFKKTSRAAIFFKDGVTNIVKEEFQYNEQKLREKLVKKAIKSGRHVGAHSLSIKNKQADQIYSKVLNKSSAQEIASSSNFKMNTKAEFSENQEADWNENEIPVEGNENDLNISDESIKQELTAKQLAQAKMMEQYKQIEEAAMNKKPKGMLLQSMLGGSTFNEGVYEKVIKTAKNIYFNNQAVSNIKNVKSGNYNDLPFAEEMKNRIMGQEKIVLQKAEQAAKQISTNLKDSKSKKTQAEGRDAKILNKLPHSDTVSLRNRDNTIDNHRMETETTQPGLSTTGMNSNPNFFQIKTDSRSFNHTSYSTSQWLNSRRQMLIDNATNQAEFKKSSFKHRRGGSNRIIKTDSKGRHKKQDDCQRVTFTSNIHDAIAKVLSNKEYQPNITGSSDAYSNRRMSNISNKKTEIKDILDDKRQCKSDHNFLIKDANMYQEFNKKLNKNCIKYFKGYQERNFKPSLDYFEIFRDYCTEPESKEVMEKAHKIYLMAPPKVRKQILRNCNTTLKQNPGFLKLFDRHASLQYVYK